MMLRSSAFVAVEYRNSTGGARTFISDIASAVEEVPAVMLDVIREKGIEIKPVDGYYLKSPDTWHPIPGFIDVAGAGYLDVVFPYAPGEKPSRFCGSRTSQTSYSRRSSRRFALRSPARSTATTHVARGWAITFGRSSDAARTPGLPGGPVAGEYTGPRRHLATLGHGTHVRRRRRGEVRSHDHVHQ